MCGLRRSNADKRKAVEILLQDAEWQTWSDGTIARHCGVSQPFVSKVRQELSHNGYDMLAARQVQRGDTIYEMDTHRIGTANGEPGSARQVRQTVHDVYGPGIPIPPPPVERPHAMEESLGDLYSRLLMFLEAVERKGGQAQLWQGWTIDRQRDWLTMVVEMRGRWTQYAQAVQDAAPQASLTIVAPVEGDGDAG